MQFETTDNDNNKKEELTLKQKVQNKNSTKNNKFYLGVIFALLTMLLRGYNVVHIKIIQKKYPNVFNTVHFLFYRSITFMTLSSLHSFLFKSNPISRLSAIPKKFCFFYRTNMNFVSMFFSTSALYYIRPSTSQTISSIAPILGLLLSYIILKEPFYCRYVFGGCLCLIGMFIITYSEQQRKMQALPNQTTDTFNISDTIIGVILMIFSVFFGTSISVANKILVQFKVNANTQLFYTGLSAFIYAILYKLILGTNRPFIDCENCYYMILCCLHGVCFYISNMCYNFALGCSELSRLILVNYTQIIFVFMFSAIILHETIYKEDILGTIIILSYSLFDWCNPLKNK